MTFLANRHHQQPSILCVSQAVLLLNLHNLGRWILSELHSAASPQSDDNNSKFHLKLYFMLMN